MDVKSKDWKQLRKDLEADIKEAQKRVEKEEAKTMELMLKLLENCKIKRRSKDK